MLSTVQMKILPPGLCMTGSVLDLCYSKSNNSWLCCNGLNVYTLSNDNTSTNIEASNAFVITAMALSPENETIALCQDKSVCIHVYPDCCSDNVYLQNVVRKDLDITHIAYEKDGAHM
jgi:hypothetical protein